MLYEVAEQKYEPDPRLEHALDVLFILHADHEQNCSASAVRSVGSSQVDPYSAVAAGVAALYGPWHGGANEAVLRMLHRIGRKENIPAFIEGVKQGKERLMWFGHRVYKNYDPRARIIKTATYEVFEVTGTNPLLDIATELEKIALEGSLVGALLPGAVGARQGGALVALLGRGDRIRHACRGWSPSCSADEVHRGHRTVVGQRKALRQARHGAHR